MNEEEKNTWLKKNTFHHGEFWDILKLVEEKEKKEQPIHVCIPTRGCQRFCDERKLYCGTKVLWEIATI